MEWEQILSELVGFVKTSAPALWAIYRRQVLVEIVQCALWLACSLWCCFALEKLGKRLMKLHNDAEEKRKQNAHYTLKSDMDIGAWIAWGTSVLCAFISLALVSGIIGYIINPDYYIIEMMLMAIGK